jgi:ribosomal protein S18 acetylase RimI-like enzyme
MHQLYAEGERDLSLFATLANTEAIALYESLAFVLQ